MVIVGSQREREKASQRQSIESMLAIFGNRSKARGVVRLRRAHYSNVSWKSWRTSILVCFITENRLPGISAISLLYSASALDSIDRSIDRSTEERVNRRIESVCFAKIRMIMNFSITFRLFEQVLESALGFGIWRQPARKRQHVVDIRRASRKLLDWHRKCLSFRMQFGSVTLPPRLSSFSS